MLSESSLTKPDTMPVMFEQEVHALAAVHLDKASKRCEWTRRERDADIEVLLVPSPKDRHPDAYPSGSLDIQDGQLLGGSLSLYHLL